MKGNTSASRRTLLRGAALVPVAGIGAAACAPEGGSGQGSRATPTAPITVGKPGEVPDGGARLFEEQNVVVSRRGDEYKAFTVICTHAGCPIRELTGTELVCSCHGSKFDATTGKVLEPPATEPLAAVPVKADGDRLVVGPGTA